MPKQLLLQLWLLHQNCGDVDVSAAAAVAVVSVTVDAGAVAAVVNVAALNKVAIGPVVAVVVVEGVAVNYKMVGVALLSCV